MIVTAVDKDIDALTITLEAEFAATPERVWQLWADPRQLERWWGPPDYPATVTEHDLSVGGRVRYHMSSPEGERYPGYWIVQQVDPPRSLVFKDGFVGEDGVPDDEMPTSITAVSIFAAGGGRTRMVLVSTAPDAEAMAQLIEMGADEGLQLAVGQIDAILAEDAA
jgi:uncharacterized protein YndB with AHSA1/START domain